MELPDWKTKLRGLLPEALELEWLADDQQSALRAGWLETWKAISFEDPFHTDCRERLARCLPLAVGPTRSRRLSHATSELTLVADPREPEIIFVSLSFAMPAMAWLRATADSLWEVLEPYLSEESLYVADLPRVARIAKVLGPIDRAVIEQIVEHTELWVDDAFWYSDFDDDPWSGVELPSSNPLHQAAWLREVAREHPGRFPAVSWRTLWSKSVMRVEQHTGGIWVFELRYSPARDEKVIAYLNDILGAQLPSDLPLDLAASLLRGPSFDEIHIADMRARGEVLNQLLLTCAIAPGELTTCQALRDAAREYADDEAVLDGIVDIATEYRFKGLCYELAATHSDTPFGDRLKDFLTPPALQEES